MGTVEWFDPFLAPFHEGEPPRCWASPAHFGSMQQCLLIWGRRHLEGVLDAYVRHYNEERPHRSLALRPPTGIEVRAGPDAVPAAALVRRRDRLDGLVHEYDQVAA
jgi:hypothetical protein